ncbi:MAG: acyloxyacyl hydrolase [Stellaceae bacterium]
MNLGSWWEFRTGAELDYRFADNRRVGVGLYHMSNAGLGKENPGVELATFVLTVPFR